MISGLEEKKIYLSGVFDGEGCISAGRNARGAWFLSASAKMASKQVCDMFREVWGGTVNRDSHPTSGGLIMDDWSIRPCDAIPFLKFISEHSLVKARLAATVLPLAEDIILHTRQGRVGLCKPLSAGDTFMREGVVKDLRELRGGNNLPLHTNGINDLSMEAKRLYLAGVFDGEGCVATQRNGMGRWVVRAVVSMTSESICRMFEEVWGGGVSHMSRLTTNGFTMFRWVLNASKSAEFFEYVANTGLVKNEQAEVALPLVRSIAKYSQSGGRRGINIFGGNKVLTDEELSFRESSVKKIRSMNGARNRFGQPGLVL